MYVRTSITIMASASYSILHASISTDDTLLPLFLASSHQSRLHKPFYVYSSKGVPFSCMYCAINSGLLCWLIRLILAMSQTLSHNVSCSPLSWTSPIPVQNSPPSVPCSTAGLTWGEATLQLMQLPQGGWFDVIYHDIVVTPAQSLLMWSHPCISLVVPLVSLFLVIVSPVFLGYLIQQCVCVFRFNTSQRVWTH